MVDPVAGSNLPWRVPLQLTLVALALAICLFPQTHIALIVGPFFVLLSVHLATLLRREWKSGRLSRTPHQIYLRALTGERIARSSLEFATTIAGMLAMFQLN